MSRSISTQPKATHYQPKPIANHRKYLTAEDIVDVPTRNADTPQSLAWDDESRDVLILLGIPFQES